MAELNCEIAESRIQPRGSTPLLTIFIPTHNRAPEMVHAVESLAGQLHGGLEDKVEILISDNASGPEGRDAIRALADRFPTVSYMINAVDQGGHVQVFMAPWRARGTWTWVFGSDDALDPGGLAAVMQKLEADDPDFLTMDKQIWDRSLTRQIYATANDIPERAFDGFISLFKGVGLHQVAFLSASLEKTEAGRRVDGVKYASADTYHNYTLAYFEKHQHSKCLYIPDAYLIRRLDNSELSDYMGIAMSDVGMQFPVVMANMARPFGFTDDIFDQINGSRRISNYDAPQITFVDNIFEYQLRAIAAGRVLSYFQRLAFEQMSLNWRPHRRAQFDEIWLLSEKMRAVTEAMAVVRSQYEQMVVDVSGERDRLRQMALAFTDKKPI